jgi:hypothetical protein
LLIIVPLSFFEMNIRFRARLRNLQSCCLSLPPPSYAPSPAHGRDPIAGGGKWRM